MNEFKATLQRHREAGTCYLCSQPVLEGQPVHGSLRCHWECHRADEEKSEAAFSKVGGLEPNSTKRRPEGQGATARAAQALAVAALEAELGVPVRVDTLWNQKGVYRGKRWDLDAWGLHFSFTRDGGTFRGCASSLATMTQCVADGPLRATPSGPGFEYELMSSGARSAGRPKAATA